MRLWVLSFGLALLALIAGFTLSALAVLLAAMSGIGLDASFAVVYLAACVPVLTWTIHGLLSDGKE